MRISYYSLLYISQCLGLACASNNAPMKRAAPVATPIAVSPSENWDGDDGPWSSFTLRIGTPVQNVRVFISSTSSDTWVVSANACLRSDDNCLEQRGRLFNSNASSTWQQHGFYQLGVEQNMGISVQGVFGNDTVGLGVQGSGGPVLTNQIVAAYTSDDLHLGMFGVNPSSTNFTATDQGRPSYMSSLKEQGKIPSLSFGYMAGNQYRLKEIYGSLTLGGYDASLFEPNPLSVPVSPDATRNLLVGIQSIESANQNGTTNNLLPSGGIIANVDPTISMIWLPLQVCQAFEKAFGLTYDGTSGLYLVSSNLHSALQAQNASITFTLGIGATGGQSTNITLPYDSFDLIVKQPVPGITSQQRYFPLQRATNPSQYTLGRTFLQESYLLVDWERRNFSISQCVFSETGEANLVAITSISGSASGVSTGAKVGIAVAVVVAFIIVAAATAFFVLRRRRRRLRLAAKEKKREETSDRIRQGFEKGELGTGPENQRFEMAGSELNDNPKVPLPEWVDENARYPKDQLDRVEADSKNASVAELGEYKGFVRPLHEMYDSSGPAPRPIELPAELPTMELQGSTPSGSPRDSTFPTPSRSLNQSPFNRGPSPLSGPSTPSTPIDRRSGHPRSSLFGFLNSPAPSSPGIPSRGPSISRRQPSENSGSYISPVSRQGTFSSPIDGAEDPTFSPLSTRSPEEHQGLFGRLLHR